MKRDVSELLNSGKEAARPDTKELGDGDWSSLLLHVTCVDGDEISVDVMENVTLSFDNSSVTMTVAAVRTVLFQFPPLLRVHLILFLKGWR